MLHAIAWFFLILAATWYSDKRNPYGVSVCVLLGLALYFGNR